MSAESKNPDARRPDAGLRWAFRVIFLTALLLVTDLALQPGYASPSTLFGRDKLEHIAAFATLTVLALNGWPSRGRLLPAALLLAYGIGLEYVQSLDFVGRTAAWSDVVADLIGITAGIIAARLIRIRP